MATLEGLPEELRTFVNMYAWRRNDPVPWAEPRKPLAQSRVGLVVNACMTMPDQPPFRTEAPDFDPSLRIVPSDTDPQTLVNTYPGQAFDHAGLRADANLLIPLDRLREMTASGEIGGLTPRTVSLCGHLPHPQQLIDETAPQIAKLFEEDGADVVLLVPA
jgi:D-proline reductase (dithiol) PrdB